MKKALIISTMVLAVLACSRKTAPTASVPKEDPHAAMVAEGKNVYTAKCGRCHALKPVENYTAQRWDGILKSMIPKAKLNETESQQVTAYVMANAKKAMP